MLLVIDYVDDVDGVTVTLYPSLVRPAFLLARTHFNLMKKDLGTSTSEIQARHVIITIITCHFQE